MVVSFSEILGNVDISMENLFIDLLGLFITFEDGSCMAYMLFVVVVDVKSWKLFR